MFRLTQIRENWHGAFQSTDSQPLSPVYLYDWLNTVRRKIGLTDIEFLYYSYFRAMRTNERYWIFASSVNQISVRPEPVSEMLILWSLENSNTGIYSVWLTANFFIMNIGPNPARIWSGRVTVTDKGTSLLNINSGDINTTDWASPGYFAHLSEEMGNIPGIPLYTISIQYLIYYPLDIIFLISRIYVDCVLTQQNE